MAANDSNFCRNVNSADEAEGGGEGEEVPRKTQLQTRLRLR